MSGNVLAVIFTTCSLAFPGDLPDPNSWWKDLSAKELSEVGWFRSVGQSKHAMYASVIDGEDIRMDVFLLDPNLKFTFGFMSWNEAKSPDLEGLVCQAIKDIGANCGPSSVLATMAGLVKVSELKCR